MSFPLSTTDMKKIVTTLLIIIVRVYYKEYSELFFEIFKLIPPRARYTRTNVIQS